MSKTNTAPARFDANQAWKRGLALIGANRDLLLILAGVFFLLPQLLVDFILPEPAPGLEGDAAGQALMAIYAVWWPLVLAGLVLQATGLLCVIALLTGRDRPTVREAIGRGLRALPTLVSAQLVVGAGVGIGMLLILVPFAATGRESLIAFATVPALAFALWVYARTLLIAPAVVAGGTRNPFEAILETWRLTRGNAGRLMLFVMLLLIATGVLYLVATSIPGAFAALIGGPHVAAIVVALFGSVIAAGFSLLMAGVLTATWSQLRREAGGAD